MSTTTREFMLGEGSAAGTGAAPGSEPMQLGMGPQHPAMHGIIRILTELDGETITKADVEIGFLHRAF
jgi:NADH:ubiquinone oxidoreductase subunit D